ncbi:hypothetical protein B0A52_04146 [Exophiala mesophila]|uniref:Uncharacterized protein n=1 Tax=Exophiala mesophila TaxID=212818 RepID=A0A438NAE1_EXOME|nr:hypothetical protein B0A52_04146 [Exophiala mesophila]
MAHEKTLAESVKSNPTALGDPVSLKAEASDTSPTESDRPSQKTARGKTASSLQNIAPSPTEEDLSDRNAGAKPSLKETAQRDLQQAKEGNRSMLGDPVSLKAEKSSKDPVGDDGMGGVTGNKSRDSKL